MSEDSKLFDSTQRPDVQHSQVNLEHTSSAYILAQRRSNMRSLPLVLATRSRSKHEWNRKSC